ncbi:MAG: hypothetical protein D6695_08940, partial [Planctomycetota bacterium]
DEDRWMYPFNGTPGTRFLAATFGAPTLEFFDDRDAQYILIFNTGGLVPTGQGIDNYRTVSATLTVTVYNDSEFFYDGTYDPMASYRPLDDPAHVPDVDVGRPINLFPVGYRDGFDLTNWTETSPFNVVGDPMTDASRIRTAYCAEYSADGVATDVSLAVRDGLEPQPLGTGQADLNPGDPVPADTTFVFELDLCDPGVQRYFAEAFDYGRLNLAVVSMHGASYDPDIGPGDPSYPIYYTSENPLGELLGLTPTLTLRVRVGSAGDFNGDGTRDFFDVLEFLNDFNAQRPAADLNSDCRFDFFDVLQFLNEFSS